MLPAVFVCVGCNYANVFFFLKVKLVHIYRTVLSLPSVPIVNLSPIGGKICAIFARRITGVFAGRYITTNRNPLDKREESRLANRCQDI